MNAQHTLKHAQFAPYQRRLGGVPAAALLLQTGNELVLGAHDGGQGSIFLLQLPVVAGYLQCLQTEGCAL